MKSIVFFNNKGGVGKTTLSCNIASYLSVHCKKRVLFIDADPQCNDTQLICNGKLVDDFYTARRKQTSTLIAALKNIKAGDSAINEDILPITKNENDFKVSLIASHLRLSLFEDKFSNSWNAHIGGDLGGTRRTNWFNCLLHLYSINLETLA